MAPSEALIVYGGLTVTYLNLPIKMVQLKLFEFILLIKYYFAIVLCELRFISVCFNSFQQVLKKIFSQGYNRVFSYTCSVKNTRMHASGTKTNTCSKQNFQIKIVRSSQIEIKKM